MHGLRDRKYRSYIPWLSQSEHHVPGIVLHWRYIGSYLLRDWLVILEESKFRILSAISPHRPGCDLHHELHHEHSESCRNDSGATLLQQ
ncbi:MAG: hypothetical protein JWQ49_6718 [Edaphobacter sp.]|nr:hypothetical protein [Edaphobacter sp.]